MAYITGPFGGLISTAEAAAIWGKEESTIRKAILRGIFAEGDTCAKFGKQWVVTVEGMRQWTGDITPWKTACARKQQIITAAGTRDITGDMEPLTTAPQEPPK